MRTNEGVLLCIALIQVVDMFPSTLTAENTFDMFPRTDKSKDINVINSSHVETVALLTRK